MMKGDGELNQALEMAAQRQIARSGTPQVLEHFMGVEKVGAIKEAEAGVEGGLEQGARVIYGFWYVHRRCHPGKWIDLRW
jgi:hypothetical protein